MNAPLVAPKGMTAEEYFVWEETQLERHDYYNGEVFAMAGGTLAHNTVAGNALVALKQHFKGGPCRVFMGDVRVQLSKAQHYSYPDVFVTCDARDTAQDSAILVQFPCLIIEVLSPSTSAYDVGLKFEAYRAMESVQEVLFVHIERRSADLYQRSAAPQWTLTPLDESGVLNLKSVNVNLPVHDLFEGVAASKESLVPMVAQTHGLP
jgi:Uma2 family endonuclease